MTGITEACYCGRTGDISDRVAEGTADTPALRCPRCGDLDTLGWLPARSRRVVWQIVADGHRAVATGAA